MTKKDYVITFQIPQGVDAQIEGNTIKIKGAKGELQRTFINPRLIMSKENNQITVRCKKGIKFARIDKMLINTYRAHIKNAFGGVLHGYTAKLKVCSGHFPMTVSLSGNILSVKNFVGEKVPRTLRLVNNVKVEIKGDVIYVNGIDKDLVGQTAASIEQLTRITNKDRRVFQDGCFILKKPSNED